MVAQLACTRFVYSLIAAFSITQRHDCLTKICSSDFQSVSHLVPSIFGEAHIRYFTSQS
jgi:hypothetical protein